MKSRFFLFLLLAGFVFAPAFSQKKKEPLKFKNERDSVSYSIGFIIGTNLKSAGLTDFDEKIFLQAIGDVIANKEPAITKDQTNAVLQSYMMKLQQKKAKENLSDGQKFLDENKKKEGIVTLPSGLQYKVIKEGQGESPVETDKVTVHYTGTLISGKVFDSSIERGQPAQFQVNAVIAGWTEALKLMKPGSKWMLYIPPQLAYGEQGVQGIEPNSVLIFEVELISVDKNDNQSNPIKPE
jgi:FKBP-type peptidyl-prolyl cis-trans isomerase FklB